MIKLIMRVLKLNMEDKNDLEWEIYMQEYGA